MKNEKTFQQLVEEYFGFLITDYGFSYDRSQQLYSNKHINIYVTFAHRATPRIEFRIISEPNFTQFELEDLISDYITFEEIHNGSRISIEENFSYFSRLFRRHAQKLVYELDSLVLIALKKRFILLGKPLDLVSDNFLQNIPQGFKQQYEYIKERDKNWNPRNDW